MAFKTIFVGGKGMKEHSFEWNGHILTVYEPEIKAKGCPWVWRTEFLNAFDYADRELLRKGWHIAYYKVSDMFGCNEATGLLKKFHDYVISEFSLNPKADIFGFSRGGLYAFNYAVKYPEDVSTLYLDAPVLDIRSWPAGYGKGEGSPRDWEMCKMHYGLTEETAKDFDMNPVDRVDLLLKTGIPVILVAGDADTVVPYDENGKYLESYFRENGGRIKVIIKKGVGHHPHSLENPEEIVKFISEYRNIG